MTQQIFIAGAQRSGTTYLYTLLDQHPDITMAKPVKPEPKFFLTPENVAQGREYYESRFYTSRNTAICGEKSTSYLEHSIVADQIKSFYPDAKLIFLLRNPIDRAISNYTFSVQNGVESLPMEQAFRSEYRRRCDYDRTKYSASPFAYLKRGRYIEYLKPFIQSFGRSKLFIYFSEEIFRNPEAIRRIYGELGVNEAFSPPSLGEVVNPSAPSDTQKLSMPLSPSTQTALRRYFRAPTMELDRKFGTSAMSLWDLE